MEIKAYLTEQLKRDDLSTQNRKLLEDTRTYVINEEQFFPEKWRQFVGDVENIIAGSNQTNSDQNETYRIQQMNVNRISSIDVSFENNENKKWLFSVSAFHPMKKAVVFSSFDETKQQFETLEEAFEALVNLLKKRP